MWVFQASVVLGYLAFVLALGSPQPLKDTVLNVMLITMLTAFASIGRRGMEVQQRAAFVSMAQERTLRAQAEHELHNAKSGGGGGGGPRGGGDGGSTAGDAEVQSAARSTTTRMSSSTEHIFSTLSRSPVASGCVSSADGLQRIADLGLQEHWLIPVQHLQPHRSEGSVLGRGGFGVVVRAWYHGAAVAVKAPLSADAASLRQALESAAQELRVLRHLRHPNIVPFYGACASPEDGELWLVLEFVQGARLDSVVGPSARPGPDGMTRLRLAKEVGYALGYLHAQEPSVIHGDLKPSNVLVETLGPALRAKLVDFGLSRLMTRRAKPLGGTRLWVAPEVVLLPAAAPEPSADVFSFGRLFYMTMNGDMPTKYISSEPERASRGARATLLGLCFQVFQACTRLEPGERPTMPEVLVQLSSGHGHEAESWSPHGQSLPEVIRDARLSTAVATTTSVPAETGGLTESREDSILIDTAAPAEGTSHVIAHSASV
uniref:Protein kinase domain-containing protein n=1 Tax=Pyrodinium bahamense TaxID=73915 RepID=A0A7S0A601_9DINO|mmetsp:Transcript_23858/g.65951  ORF Transcript_23858/g.65951 Transcript_23858/m.65951 type:complete len:489 (+) Transcript_23858:2-1468(+)